MKNKLHTKIGFCFILAFVLLISIPSFSKKGQERFKPDELICEMMPGYSVDIINDLFGTSVKGYQEQTDCYLLSIRPDQNAESLAVVIGAMPEVLYCKANYYLSAPEAFQRSQPFLEDQGIITYSIQPAAIALDLPTILQTVDGADIKVAVIDCGVNLNHPVFDNSSGEVYYGWDYIDNDPISNDEPGGICSGHGTFVAGVIKLAAPASDVYCYRVLDTTGTGNGYDIASAIISAVDEGCRVINLSLGMVGIHEAVDEAIKYAEHNNVVVTAAAGNEATDSNLDFPFPASRAYCIAVAAVDSMNLLADFSNYGIKVDICAPGTGILSSYLESYFAWWDGTSFSTPFVSAQAALILSINHSMTSIEVRNIIANSAVNIDQINPGFEGLLGDGMIDIGASIEAIIQNLMGDYDESGSLNILDIIYIINYIYKDGPAPIPLISGDMDCSNSINILDVIYLINYLYKDGPPACQSRQF